MTPNDDLQMPLCASMLNEDGCRNLADAVLRSAVHLVLQGNMDEYRWLFSADSKRWADWAGHSRWPPRREPLDRALAARRHP